MPSSKSQANKHHYEVVAARPPSADRRDTIDFLDEHWTALTAEPGGVDYLEVNVAGTRALWVVPHGVDDGRVILYAHGGGFISGSMYTHRKMVGHLAKAAGSRALVYDYAYAHEHKYPHQLDTTIAVYRWLATQGVTADRIMLAGDSAGAILVVGLIQALRDRGERLPTGIALISPWLDMTQSGETFQTNAAKDAMFSRDAVSWLASNFLGSVDRRDPRASPLHAELTGLPPLCIQVGGDETLLDESRMFAARAKAAGVPVELEVFPEMLHSFQMMAGRAPEADDAIRKLGAWIRRH